MATLKSQYRSYLIENPGSSYSFDEWKENVLKPMLNDAFEELKDWDNTLLDGLEDESVVTYLIRELIENRLMALRYDKDNTLDEIINRAKAMEEQRMLRLIEYSRTMTTPAAPADYVVREFNKEEEADICPICNAPLKREGSSLHVWDAEYECGRHIWGAIDSNIIDVKVECPKKNC